MSTYDNHVAPISRKSIKVLFLKILYYNLVSIVINLKGNIGARFRLIQTIFSWF